MSAENGSTYTDTDVAALPLAGTRRDLLEGIMATPVSTDLPDSLHTPPPTRRRGWLTAAVAAAAVAAVVVPTWWVTQDDGAGAAGGPAAGPEPAPAPAPASSPPAGDGTAAGTGLGTPPEPADLEQHQVLVAQPGWAPTYVGLDRDRLGSVTLTKGERDLELNWYPAASYDLYYEDRAAIGEPQKTRVLGRDATTWAYSDDDLTTIREPQDGVFLEIRGGVGDRAAYREALSLLAFADTPTWEAALPPETVTPDERPAVVRQMLEDVPTPPGFDTAAAETDGIGDRYQVGAAAIGTVACLWLDTYLTADRDGVRRATEAMATHERWAVLQEMSRTGDYPLVVADVANGMAAGTATAEDRAGLGCS